MPAAAGAVAPGDRLRSHRSLGFRRRPSNLNKWRQHAPQARRDGPPAARAAGQRTTTRRTTAVRTPNRTPKREQTSMAASWPACSLSLWPCSWASYCIFGWRAASGRALAQRRYLLVDRHLHVCDAAVAALCGLFGSRRQERPSAATGRLGQRLPGAGATFGRQRQHLLALRRRSTCRKLRQCPSAQHGGAIWRVAMGKSAHSRRTHRRHRSRHLRRRRWAIARKRFLAGIVGKTARGAASMPPATRPGGESAPSTNTAAQLFSACAISRLPTPTKR